MACSPHNILFGQIRSLSADTAIALTSNTETDIDAAIANTCQLTDG